MNKKVEQKHKFISLSQLAKKDNYNNNTNYNKSTIDSINKFQSNSANKNQKINFYALIQSRLYEQYSFIPEDYSKLVIEYFVQGKYCSTVARFKDKIIYYFNDEFLKRYYSKSESEVRIPYYITFYKNYTNFFCKPIFCEMGINDIMQEMGEIKAQNYYSQNYGKNETR